MADSPVRILPGPWVCEFCFRTTDADPLPADWKFAWQSAICPECQPRVREDGGYMVVCGGAYAGDRIDPRGLSPEMREAYLSESPSSADGGEGR
ncbi:hypothetical protein [Alienimonas sp. DA493]|uniref:hypothetical protein n=1 Tax=Alienimonas sp. DA493 TaxID=3373605 RepID=UPI0037545932